MLPSMYLFHALWFFKHLFRSTRKNLEKAVHARFTPSHVRHSGRLTLLSCGACYLCVNTLGRVFHDLGMWNLRRTACESREALGRRRRSICSTLRAHDARLDRNRRYERPGVKKSLRASPRSKKRRRLKNAVYGTVNSR